MTVTYAVVVPWVDEAYLKECLATCKLDNLLLVDNQETNRGVSRSWNMGVDKLQSENLDWLIVLSAAVRFGASGGQDFINQLNFYNNKALIVEAVDTVLGWHLVAFSRECLHRVGRFDENFFPGYYNDLDYSVRFQRIYAEDFRETPPPTQRWKHVVIDAKDAGMAHALKHGVTADAEQQIDYFHRKWGRHPDTSQGDTYTHPFNDPDSPVPFWPSTMVDSIPGRWDSPAIPDFIDRDKVEWKTVTVNGDYWFDLPWPLCDWENLREWERTRFQSLAKHLKSGDVFYDIGAEIGWCSLIPALYVGAQNMVLIEPSGFQWPNIRATWNRNYAQPPLACYDGFVGDVTTDTRSRVSGWPVSSDGPMVTHISYQHMFNDTKDIPQMTLDDLVEDVRRTPDALNIDVEGAELSVLNGASRTLRTAHPKVWLSIHPDLMQKWYGTTPEQVHELMTAHGYVGEYLGQDHEDHWLFTHQGD